MELSKMQKDFLKALGNSGLNISAASESVGINRRTYYRWLENEKFAEEVEFHKESIVDYAESKLMMAIKNGNIAAVIFFLKTRAKDRGYIEKQEIVHGGMSPTLVQLVKEAREGEIRNKKKTEELITALKTYSDDGLDLKQACGKLLEDENITLDEFIEAIGKEITLLELIGYFEQIEFTGKLKNIINYSLKKQKS